MQSDAAACSARTILAFVFLVVFVPALLVVGACSNEGARVYQGYAEGEYVRVAAPFAGTLQKLAVSRGMQIKGFDKAEQEGALFCQSDDYKVWVTESIETLRSENA